MAKRISNEVVKRIINSTMEKNNVEHYEYALNKIEELEANNRNKTGEILAQIATKKIQKSINYPVSINFVKNACNFENLFVGMGDYVDPDKSSVLLYEMWVRYLLKFGIIKKFKIIYENYWFRLNVTYEYEGKSL